MTLQAAKRFDKNLFKKTVIDTFRFLQDKYGFSMPTATDYGREIFVNFERGNQTVSISYEFSGSPRIEFLYPSTETGDRPVPWAEKITCREAEDFRSINLLFVFLMTIIQCQII